jgi:polar amino acid transport system substrate-binding protein
MNQEKILHYLKFGDNSKNTLFEPWKRTPLFYFFLLNPVQRGLLFMKKPDRHFDKECDNKKFNIDRRLSIMLKKILMIALTLFILVPCAFSQTVITVAADTTWPPMEYVNKDKAIVGFTPDLLAAMEKVSDIKFDIRTMAWDDIFEGLYANKYDMISSSLSITDARKKTMSFSDPYFEVKQGVLTKKTSNIKSEADLKGKKIGAQIGTTGFLVIQKIEGVIVKSYDEIGPAVEDLYNGLTDAVVCDDAVAANYPLTNERYSKDLILAFLLKSDKPEYLGFAFKKGKSQDKIKLVNDALKKVINSGEYIKIYERWF